MRETVAALVLAAFLLGTSPADAQQQQPLTGLFYFAVENLDAGRIEQRGVAGSGGAAFSNLRLANRTRYRIWLLEAATLRVGRTEVTTSASGGTVQIPAITMRDPASFDDDSDGLSLQGERIVGCDPRNPDSDGDLISDGAEVQQGTDPLDGLPGRTGVIASVDTPGTALDVCASDDYVVVADGAAGVSVFNVFNRLNPQTIARVAIPGESRKVSCEGRYVAVAGSAGLSIVDLIDPPAARISSSVSRLLLGGGPSAVAVVDRVAYVGLEAGSQVVTVDLETGGILNRVAVTEEVLDLAIERDAVFLATGTGIRPLRIRGPGAPTFTQPIALPSLKRIFVGGGYAYGTRGNGFLAVDVRDLNAPTVLAGTGAAGAGWKQLVRNGSGLGVGVVAGNPGAPANVHLYDQQDPTQTATFVGAFPTPGGAQAVSIYNGLAYVADGESGLQVVNFLSYDTAGVAPVITLTTSFTGSSVEEGKSIWLSAECRDDVQVRNVEFWVDGVKARTDGNFPFEFPFTSPTLAQQASFTIRARVSDTGGNRTWTPLRTITLAADSTAPTVLRTAPRNGAVLGGNVAVAAVLSEPANSASVSSQTFQLEFAGPDRTFGTTDDTLVSAAASFDANNLTAFLTPTILPLAAGVYRATLGTGVQDAAGNALATAEVWTFTVYGSVDSDGDGIPDELESFLGLNPNDPDSDNDGTPDGLEDSDSDGLSNLGEVLLGLDPSNPDTDANGTADGLEDPDQDGLGHGQR